MVITIVLTGDIGDSIADEMQASFLRHFRVMERLAEQIPGYTNDQMQMTIDPVAKSITEAFPEMAAPAAGTASRHIVAILPVDDQGNFDQERIPAVVRKNLEDLGKGTMSAVLYQDIVNHTLAQTQVTERMLRDKHHFKAGACQGRIQDMRRQKIIETRPIIHTGDKSRG